MTFAELLAAAVECLGPKDSVSLDVCAWHYADGSERLDWRIWSTGQQKHWSGKTAEAALASLRLDVDHTDAQEMIKAVVMRNERAAV
jgi:hypothetical protein